MQSTTGEVMVHSRLHIYAVSLVVFGALSSFCGLTQSAGGIVVTSSITNAAVDDLELAVGKDAYAVVKASDVMVGVD